MSDGPRKTRNGARGALAVVAVVGLAAVVTATPARAHGDPASDYLLSRNVFVPFDAKIASTLAQQLAGLTLDAKRKRYPIKVALIATPYELGTARALWRKPQQYAHFLASGQVPGQVPGLAVQQR